MSGGFDLADYLILNDANNECEHEKLATDRIQTCGCWTQERINALLAQRPLAEEGIDQQALGDMPLGIECIRNNGRVADGQGPPPMVGKFDPPFDSPPSRRGAKKDAGQTFRPLPNSGTPDLMEALPTKRENPLITALKRLERTNRMEAAISKDVTAGNGVKEGPPITATIGEPVPAGGPAEPTPNEETRAWHDWYMADGRRTIKSVATFFRRDVRNVRARFEAAGLHIKPDKKPTGVVAQRKSGGRRPSKARVRRLAAEREARDRQAAARQGATGAATSEQLIASAIEAIDREIGALRDKRDALAAI